MKKVSNPPNRYHASYQEWIDAPPDAGLQVYEEHAKSIVTENESPDIPFRFSVNPYRGCFHACAYCYARPTHQYLDFGVGTDFERKLIVKVNAPQLLRTAFKKKSWQGHGVVFSGITDCYQPLELHYEITRQCLKVCLETGNPVMIITKGAIIRRDIDLLRELARDNLVNVMISLAFSDDEMSKKIEPSAPRPSVRLRALKELVDAGVPTGIALAPVIPGLNDVQIPRVLEAAKEAGATSAFMTLLRLPAEVKDVFSDAILEAYPDRAKKVLNQLKAMKGGTLNRSEFGKRMKGEGAHWEAIKWLFNTKAKELGFNADVDPRPGRKERAIKQLQLF